MRLICPNCGAQYEVAGDIVPDGGRDVQCSNCGHTWFERPGASEAAEKAIPQPVRQPRLAPVPEPAPEPEPEPTPELEPEPVPELDSVPEPAPEPEDAQEPEPDDDPEHAPLRRDLDPDVAKILREEAEYEQSARQAEADPIESQPDLGLNSDPDETRRAREARGRLARLRGEEEEREDVAEDVDALPAPTPIPQDDAPRRELLPDIEEINSSLRPDAAPSESDDGFHDIERKSGFRRGFTFMVVLALLALAVYVFAPQISAAVPTLDPILTSYVEWMDEARLWLDLKIQDLIEQGTQASEQ